MAGVRTRARLLLKEVTWIDNSLDQHAGHCSGFICTLDCALDRPTYNT